MVNSGRFEMVPPYQDYVTVQKYDPVTHATSVFNTIYTQSAQDIVIADHFAYVAAQDSIIKYNLDNYQRVAAIADSGLSKLCIFNDKLIVSKQYPIKRFFVEVLDLNLALLAFVEGIGGDCGGITTEKDTAYVAMNGGWLGTVGKLCVINTHSWTLVRQQNFGPNAIGIKDIYNYGGHINCIDNTPYGGGNIGAITAYNFYQASYVNNVMDVAVGDGAGIIGNLLYLKINDGIGAYNLDTQILQDTVVIPDPGSINHRYIISSGVDYVNNHLYVNIGTQSSNGIGVITNLNGDSLTSFPEGISTECIAFDYRTPVGLEKRNDAKLNIFPNPFVEKFNVVAGDGISVLKILVQDITGKILYTVHPESAFKSTIQSLSGYPSGVYFLKITTNNGVETRKLIKQ
ncbi:MAG: T9SS type A sorting domain-containing protein [Bacteroidota bacterium]